MRQGISHRHGSDLFGRQDAGADGADPGSEMVPDFFWARQRQVLKQPLDDQAALDVAVVGGEFAADWATVEGGGTVEVLVFGKATDGFHRFHPEVIGVGADGS